MTITEISIKRPSLIIVIFAALITIGLFSFSKLKYELLPKFSPPVLTITTIYPGASPSEVESGVTKFIEDAVSGMDNVDEVTSTSMEGVSFVVVQLLQSANIDFALQDAQRKTSAIINDLPSTAKTPTVSKIALDEIPIIRMGISSNMNTRELYQFVKDKVKPQLTRIPGVGQLSLIGGDEREIKVNIDLQRLKAYGLSIVQVTQAIQASNLDFPTGSIKDRDKEFTVRLAGKLSSVEDLRNLPIAESRQGGEIKLTDIAEVEDGIKEHNNMVRINFRTTIAAVVQKQTDANSVEVANLIKKEISKMETQYKDLGLKFDVAMDNSLFTVDAVDAVKEDLAIAVVLVAIVMLMFLHSVRNSVIVLIAIPSSLISTFIAVYALGFTLNLMTLLGLSLVVGILVDDSIVVLENIYHHLEKGEEKKVAALRGRNEIGFAALAITFVDVAVFLPLAMVGGIIGNIMRQFAIVIVVSTLMSLFVSFTLTPFLASRFAKLERLTDRTLLGRFALWFEKKFKAFTESYIKLLGWSFKNRGKVAIITIVMFFASLSLLPFGFIGFEFMPQTDRGEFAVQIDLEPGTSLEKTNFVSQQIENVLQKYPEIERIFTNAGSSSEGLIGFSSSNSTEIVVTLVGKDKRSRSTGEIKNHIKDEIQKIPGAKVRVNEIGIFGTANQTPIQLLINGPSYNEVLRVAKQLSDSLKYIPGTADIRLSSQEGNPETHIEIDRRKLVSYGLTIAEVGSALQVAFTGNDNAKLREGDTDYNVRVILDEFDRSKTEELYNIPFVNKKGQQIYLKQFANVYQATGPTKLTRHSRSASVVIYSQAVNRSSGVIASDITKILDKYKFPAGITYSWQGDIKSQNESFGDLGLVFIAGIIFTYMIMVALYDSFAYPFVILFSIPLAIIGAFLALALAMKALSVFTILGILMLIGLVSKNAILLVDRTNYMRSQGESVHDALVDAGRMRIRPIFMTTLTMIFGMLPIALSSSSGSEWKSGLAWSLIGGLTSSLFLTLIVVPLVYTKVEEVKVAFVPFVKKLFNRFSKNEKAS